MIKVRFAPSPTGYLHIGGARTALFNWLYARAQGGHFILRVEDTDRARSKKEYVDEILDSLMWLGLSWDALYYQSRRLDIYRRYAERLLDEGRAYRDGEAVVLKMPEGEVVLYDLIRGEIRFDTQTIKDQVLMKSDGTPTYSFACVVDDALMEITHVIRGEDHISNTPKQIVIYRALGLKPPKYAHLPLIMGEDGGRLSKRTGAVAVSEYRKMGFIPEGIDNYLMLLGWSPPGEEVLGLDEAVKRFSIKKVNKTAAVFSMEKLRWVNGQQIRRGDSGALAEALLPFLRGRGYISEDFDRKRLESIVQLFQTRMSTLLDFCERADYFFLERPVIDGALRKEYLSGEKREPFRRLAGALSGLDGFSEAACEQAFRRVVGEMGMKPAELVHPVRVALSGKTVGPGLFETMALLGRDRTVRRLQDAMHESDEGSPNT